MGCALSGTCGSCCGVLHGESNEARHRPERHYDACDNRKKQCRQNETKPNSNASHPRKRHNTPRNSLMLWCADRELMNMVNLPLLIGRQCRGGMLRCTAGVGWSSRVSRVCVMMWPAGVDVMMRHGYGMLSVPVLVVQSG